MDKEKVYYLSHPCTSFGDRSENIIKSKLYALTLRLQGYKIINPIAILNETDDKIAMGKCKELFDICDGVIFCPGYSESTGCKEEFTWSHLDDKEIYYLSKVTLEITPHSSEVDSNG